MRELIELRKRAGFVGRRSEIDLFQGNFDISPEDGRHSFVFHIHGTAGVGKSSLVRELEAAATQHQALTACTDESVNSVPEVMTAISAQFARQGVELKALEKLLATYRQRRHEAEAASASPEPGQGIGQPPPPSAGSMATAQAGLIGLGLVPGVGAFAGAVDPFQVAHGTDRLRAALSARFRNYDEVQLVLEPLSVLTPVFVAELDRVADDAPWIALFFDTYERTAPFLDSWLLDLITTNRYGALPANVVVTLAGQHGPNLTRWADYAGFVTEIPLEPFTESEARQLLASRGVVEEDVVREVLRLSGCLPVLVSTLAENPGVVDDPTATVVERFLEGERDPARREAALMCALPRQLDEDVFRATVHDGEVARSYEWLRGMPFVSERVGRLRYHDVVRTAMLRLQRTRSPRQWAERHARLAEVFGEWRAGAEQGLEPDEWWLDEPWRELRLEESYHLLCARPQTALRQVLADFVDACRVDAVAARGCVQALADAGEHTDAKVLRAWGRDLLAAVSGESATVLSALGLLLDRAGLDAETRAEAHSVRGHELRQTGEDEKALVEFDQAVALAQNSARAYHERGLLHALLSEPAAALADLDRADALRPDTVGIIFDRGMVLQHLDRHEEAVASFDRVLVLEPADRTAWVCRGYSKHVLGDGDGALGDFNRALEIDGEYLWALAHRAEVYRRQGRLDESFADLDHAVRAAPDSAWIASERGDAYRLEGRYEEAVTELGRACELDMEHASAHASRGDALLHLNRVEEALAALDRAIELEPTYVWALLKRARLRGDMGDEEGRLTDLDLAVAAESSSSWALHQRSVAHLNAGRFEEALADADLAVEREPDNVDHRDIRGIALSTLGKHAELVAQLDRMLEHDPDDWRALGARGRNHLSLRQYPESLRDLGRAISLRADEASLYAARANTCIAIGRLEQALADLGQCAERGHERDWVRGRTVDVLLMQGRYDEAVPLLEAIHSNGDLRGTMAAMGVYWYVDAMWAADVMTGQWERARQLADWLYANHPDGAVRLSLTVGLREGAEAAEPLWRKARSIVTDVDAPDIRRILPSCALEDWNGSDTLLSVALAADHDWEDLAHLADLFSLLARCPGVDAALVRSRLVRVVEARDVLQSRYAE
ncbi:tetratricopeptide repeat protein [Streptomyces phaeochromogenes]